jgi:hypothetical protein
MLPAMQNCGSIILFSNFIPFVRQSYTSIGFGRVFTRNEKAGKEFERSIIP